MAAIDISYYAKEYARAHVTQRLGDVVSTSRLKVQVNTDPKYTIVTPYRERNGPRLARMRCNDANKCFMNVSSKAQTLEVNVSIAENGIKGLNKRLTLKPPMQFELSADFEVDLGKAEQRQSLKGEYRAPLQTAKSPRETDVRLKETGSEADFTVDVLLKGSIIYQHGQQTLAEIIRHLQHQGDPAARRFTVRDQGVTWTVSGEVSFTLTSAQ